MTDHTKPPSFTLDWETPTLNVSPTVNVPVWRTWNSTDKFIDGLYAYERQPKEAEEAYLIEGLKAAAALGKPELDYAMMRIPKMFPHLAETIDRFKKLLAFI